MTKPNETQALRRSHTYAGDRGSLETWLFRSRLARRHPPFASNFLKFSTGDFDLTVSPLRPPPPAQTAPIPPPQETHDNEVSPLVHQDATVAAEETEDGTYDEQPTNSVEFIDLISNGTTLKPVDLPSSVNPPNVALSESSESSSTEEDFVRFKCTLCELHVPAESFAAEQLRRARRGNKARCRSCVADSDRLRKYGLTRASYLEMLKEQKNACWICKIDLSQLPLKKVHVDHCAKAGTVRGILCMECNTGIGKLDHSLSNMLAACHYLIVKGNGHNSDGTTTVALSRVVLAWFEKSRADKTQSSSTSTDTDSEEHTCNTLVDEAQSEEESKTEEPQTRFSKCRLRVKIRRRKRVQK